MNKVSFFVKTGLLALALVVSSTPANAQVSSALESLGNNEDIAQKAHRLDGRSRVGIVQNRSVPRDWRFELGANFGPVAAGDSYLYTQHLGGQLELHVNPKVSLGVRYAKAFNSLTAEGVSRFEEARRAKAAAANYTIPDIDYPEESLIGTLTWYMMYGKLNFFDVRSVQFDLYGVGGAGNVTLSSGPTTTYTAGGGIGFWLTNHITSRFEIRWQAYSDKVYTGERDLNLIVANFGLGVLL